MGFGRGHRDHSEKLQQIDQLTYGGHHAQAVISAASTVRPWVQAIRLNANVESGVSAIAAGVKDGVFGYVGRTDRVKRDLLREGSGYYVGYNQVIIERDLRRRD
jgi:hypothetical protein